MTVFSVMWLSPPERARDVGRRLPDLQQEAGNSVPEDVGLPVGEARPLQTYYHPTVQPAPDARQDRQPPPGRHGALFALEQFDESPTFVVVGEQDSIAPPLVMERRVSRLGGQGTTVESTATR